ncbi:MAG: hypothetical protein H0X39_03960 [Actinobacteria bacterium]|nr:hypothetical protein [Actinomycetota bacterium]
MEARGPGEEDVFSFVSYLIRRDRNEAGENRPELRRDELSEKLIRKRFLLHARELPARVQILRFKADPAHHLLGDRPGALDKQAIVAEFHI